MQILVDDRPAITTTQAAQQHGLTTAGLRAIISQNGIEPVAHLDARTPLYDAAELDRALKARPGRGAHWRRGT